MSVFSLDNEDDILKAEVRKAFINHIKSNANVNRKKEARRRQDLYNDQTDKYVKQKLAMFSPETVIKMEYAISNISILKKVINKLARVYNNGVNRQLKKKRDTKMLQELSEELCVDAAMKKANRYLKNQKNIELYVRPKQTKDGKWDLRLQPITPDLYDVVVRKQDKTEKIALVLSDFDDSAMIKKSIAPASEGRGFKTPGLDTQSSYVPPENERYIWWGDRYHFTFNGKGEIVGGPEDGLNPIGTIPSVSLSIDQDDTYWSKGGYDLADSSISINCLISNAKHIGVTQGYGQAVMTGKNLPGIIDIGPQTLIRLEQKEGEPTPTFGFANSSPPLNELKEQIVMETALVLSTNNLSTSGVKVNLDSGMGFPSGIAMLIDKAESVEDVKDQQTVFKDAEPDMWKIVSLWLDLYRSRDLLVERLMPYNMTDTDVNITFKEPEPLVSETEHLAALEKRKTLGINTMVEIVQMDDKNLTDEEAQAKLDKIEEEKKARMEAVVGRAIQDGKKTGEQKTDGDRDQDQARGNEEDQQ